MEIQAAILCDFAQVREGVLFVASGGVSRLIRRPGEPSSIAICLAAIIELLPNEIPLVHEITVTVTRDSGGQTVGVATAAFQYPPQMRLEPGEAAVVPIAISLAPVTITDLGMYDVRISVDGGVPAIRTLYVVPPPQGHPLATPEPPLPS